MPSKIYIENNILIRKAEKDWSFIEELTYQKLKHNIFKNALEVTLKFMVLYQQLKIYKLRRNLQEKEITTRLLKLFLKISKLKIKVF